MKLAYIILAYKDVEQVSRLINRLRAEGSSFVVHVCKNTDNAYIEQLKKLQEQHNDVYFCKREEGIHFYFGLVKGTLNALQLLSEKKIDYDYVSLISGQDYPLKTNKEIIGFLSKNRGKEFLSYWPLTLSDSEEDSQNHPWGESRQMYRVDRYHIKFSGKVNSIPEIETDRLIDHNLYNTLKIFLYQAPSYYKKGVLKRELLLLFYSRILPKKRALPKSFILYGGSTWWTITKQLTEHILQTNKNNGEFNTFFKYTLIPDEMYFQTHAMNSPFRENIVNNNLREIIWNPEDKTHPILFTGKDFNFLTKSPALFARKFDAKLSAEIVNQLDTHLESTKQII
jgi:hypothetical protein